MDISFPLLFAIPCSFTPEGFSQAGGSVYGDFERVTGDGFGITARALLGKGGVAASLTQN